MAELSLTGKLIAAMPTQSGIGQKSGNKWVKRDYVLEIPGQYPKNFVFTVFGEDRLKEWNLRKDEEITVFFEIDAHEYNNKWYNSVTAYKVERVGQQQPAQPAPQQQQAEAPAPPPQQDGAASATDDLPF